MVGPGDFVPVTLQAVLFTPDEGLAVPRLVRELAPKWTRFDALPAQLPDLPALGFAEVPRAILRSLDGRWQFEAGQARASLFCRETEEHEFPESVDRALADAAAMFVEYRSTFNMRVGRLAAVLMRAAPATDPGFGLAKHFCREEWWQGQPLNRPAAFEIHAHKRYEISDWGSVNSWMRVKTGHRAVGGQQHEVIVAEQDINTVVEDANGTSYSDEEIRTFFSRVSREFDEILRLYFPQGER
jgi:hypothetical protein